MTRLQKKCLLFSLGLHGLLAVILLGSAGFGSRPQQVELQILHFIPANIIDRAGAGGGAQMVNPTTQPQVQAPPRATPPQPQPPAVRVEQAHTEPVRPKPIARAESIQAPVEKEEAKELAMEPKSKTSHERPRHEVKPTFTLAHASAGAKKNQEKPSSQSSSRAEARRLKEIENALNGLASDVRSSGSPNNIVDMDGIGGGDAFAGYRDVVYSAYYRAFRPEDVANRSVAAEAKVTIASDGSIVVSELVRPSDDKALDRSVERALREVTKLPPFPASARDTQRTFVIRFSPEAKEMSG